MTSSRSQRFVLTLACANRPGIVAAVSGQSDIDALKSGFVPLSERFGMTWTLRDPSEKRRVMLLVSRFDHCLADLLYRWRIGELPMEVAGIVANHPAEAYAHLDVTGVPFHHLPVTRESKPAQEEALWALVQESRTELVVLARYMQVLSNQLAARLSW